MWLGCWRLHGGQGATAASAPLSICCLRGSGSLQTGTRCHQLPRPSCSQIRLPRIVLAGLVGAALAVAGATYQGVFRNPLADPYLLGVASGASLGAVLAFILPIPADLSRGGAVQLLAFVGAIIAVVAVYLLARVGGSVPTTTLLLAGIAISAAASAATAYLMYIRGDQLLVIYSWLLGGFNVASWQEVRLITPMVLLSTGVMVLGGRIMNYDAVWGGASRRPRHRG